MACYICGSFFGVFNLSKSGVELCDICSKNREHIEKRI